MPLRIERLTVTTDQAATSPARWTLCDGVATVELHRPGASNALDLPMATALSEVVDQIAADEQVRVVLLVGSGRNFCAGGDLAAMAGAVDRSAYVKELATTAHRAVLGLSSLSVPVVAAVQGAAAGAGLALTLVADLVVAGDSARFLTAYAAIGLTPDCGTSWLLPQVVGLRRAMDLAVGGRQLSAAEALDWGLVTSVCPDEELAETAGRLADRLASGPAAARGVARRLLRDGVSRSFAEQLDQEAAAIAASVRTPEAQQLVTAFASRAGG